MFVTEKRKQLALDIFENSARHGFYQLTVNQVFHHSMNMRGLDPDIGRLKDKLGHLFPTRMGIGTVARVLRQLSDERVLEKTQIPSTSSMDWTEDEDGFNPDSEAMYAYRLTAKKVRDQAPRKWAPEHRLERI